MGSWKRFNKTILPSKEEFYSNFNVDHITQAWMGKACDLAHTCTHTPYQNQRCGLLHS